MGALSTLKLSNNTAALFLSTIGGSVIRLVTNLILARLLFPEAFAIVGIVSSTMFVMELITDFGFDTYIIRHKQGNRSELLNTLWTIRLVRGFILTSGMALLSWEISDFLEYPEIQPVLFASSFLLILSSLESFAFAVSIRAGYVSKPLYADLLAYFISTLFTVFFTFYSRNYWALIYGMYIYGALKLLLSYLLFEKSIRSIKIHTSYLPEFFNFAKIILPSSIIYILLAQGDKIIIAKSLSAAQLGLYYVAFNFSSSANSLVSAYSSRVLFPVYAEVFREQPDKLAITYNNKKSIVFWILCFGFGMLIGGSYLFFDLLYDDRYLDAAIFLSILLIHPVLGTISLPAESCLIAVGRTKVTLVVNILRLVWAAVGAYIGFMLYGGVGVVWAFATIELIPIFYLFIQLLELKLLNLYREAVNPILAVLGYLTVISLNSVL